ncbi:MAG: hypothetical protein RMI30_03290 [Thermodesulfovibrio sp.]|nr:hypothetical protein [Thermodesulfovibrio sp.]
MSSFNYVYEKFDDALNIFSRVMDAIEEFNMENYCQVRLLDVNLFNNFYFNFDSKRKHSLEIHVGCTKCKYCSRDEKLKELIEQNINNEDLEVLFEIYTGKNKMELYEKSVEI